MDVESVKLDQRKKLVDAVADWLLDQVDRNGLSPSLSHVLTVVPTSQAGRSLRLALACRAGAVLSPRIVMPMRLIYGDAEGLPSQVESLALWTETLESVDISGFRTVFRDGPGASVRRFDWALARARELTALQHELGAAALDFSDVASRIEGLLNGDGLDVEIARWRELALLEKKVRAAAAEKGLVLPNDLIKRNVSAPVVPEGISVIALPALADRPRALDVWLENISGTDVRIVEMVHGISPVDVSADFEIDIPDDCIEIKANAKTEAARTAELGVGGAAVCIADPSRFPETEAAFLSRAVILHNPAPHKLRSSSLGRLIMRLRELEQPDCSWSTVSSFARDDDVRQWLAANGFDWSGLLSALDRFQNDNLPQSIADADGCCKSQEVSRYLDLIRRTAAAGIESALRDIYAHRRLNPDLPGDAEFIAAATFVREICAEASGRYERYFSALFEDASYQLEPYSPGAIAAEGWLELQWSAASRIVISGFNEGVVPASRVGHPFLPDRLASALGLQSNAERERRDAYLLNSILACRDRGAVRILLAKKNGDGEPLKPSRLLFRIADDEQFKIRVASLYLGSFADDPLPPKKRCAFWDLDLRCRPVERISPSGLDTYLRNPLEFLLSNVMGLEQMERDDLREYDALQFGTICHAVLKRFADSQLSDSQDPEQIFGFLKSEVSRHFVSSGVLPLLQKMTMLARMERFAGWQAAARSEGWRIFQAEKSYEERICGVDIRGQIDRIDRNEATGAWRIIDYKTWDSYEANKPWTFSQRSGLNLKSLQLPLYRKLCKCECAEIGYLLLTERAEEQMWHSLDTPPELQKQLDERLLEALDRLKTGLFDAGEDNVKKLPEHLKRWMQ